MPPARAVGRPVLPTPAVPPRLRRCGLIINYPQTAGERPQADAAPRRQPLPPPQVRAGARGAASGRGGDGGAGAACGAGGWQNGCTRACPSGRSGGAGGLEPALPQHARDPTASPACGSLSAGLGTLPDPCLTDRDAEGHRGGNDMSKAGSCPGGQLGNETHSSTDQKCFF